MNGSAGALFSFPVLFGSGIGRPLAPLRFFCTTKFSGSSDVPTAAFFSSISC